MRTVFADTGYWIALSNDGDEWHGKAENVTAQLGIFKIVTSQMVLAEYLNFMGGHGQLRSRAVSVIEKLVENPGVEIVAQSSDQFDSAVSLYSSRLDKIWSLTDCSTFVLMEQMHIVEALAHDHNFEQAGFVALLRETRPPTST